MTLLLPVPFDAALEAVKSADIGGLKKFVKGVLDVVSASVAPGSSDSLVRARRRELLSSPDATSKRSTLLHWAAYLDNLDAAKLLVHYGGDIDAVEADGKTPLHWAGFEGNAEMVQLLLRVGANYELLDNAKQTACHLAIINQHVDVARLFPNYHAIAVSSPYIPLNDPDPDYQTPFRPLTPRRIIEKSSTTVGISSTVITTTLVTDVNQRTENTQLTSTAVQGATKSFSQRSSSSVSSNLEAQLDLPQPIPVGGKEDARRSRSNTSDTCDAPRIFSAAAAPSLDSRADIEAIQNSPLYEAVFASPPVIGSRAVIPPPPQPILSPEEEAELRRREKEQRRAERRLRKADKRRELIHELVAMYAEEEERIARQRIHWLPPSTGHVAADGSSDPTTNPTLIPSYAAPPPVSRVAIPSTRFPPDQPPYRPRATQKRPKSPRSVTPHYRPPWRPPSCVAVEDPALAVGIHKHVDPLPMKKFDVRSY